MTRMGLIYCATNVITGQVYIGQTAASSFAKRMKEHYRYSYQKHRREWKVKFHEAIRVHGWSNFKWTILYSAIPEGYIDLMERWCIYNYNSFENGYNSHAGGRTVNSKLKTVDSQEPLI